MIPTVRDRMTSEFVRLNLNESLANARAILKNKGSLLGIVMDDEDRPVTITTISDLGEGQAELSDQLLSSLVSKLPPGIMISADVTLEAFVSSGAFTALDEGAHGAIVTDQDKAVGILTEAAIDDFLAQEFESTIRTKGDTGLSGSIVIGLVVKYCEEFGHRNELKYYSRHKPLDCQVKQPYVHPLRRKA